MPRQRSDSPDELGDTEEDTDGEAATDGDGDGEGVTGAMEAA